MDDARMRDVLIFGRLNSPGGDVMEGIGIYTLLKNYPARVTARFVFENRYWNDQSKQARPLQLK